MTKPFHQYFSHANKKPAFVVITRPYPKTELPIYVLLKLLSSAWILQDFPEKDFKMHYIGAKCSKFLQVISNINKKKTFHRGAFLSLSNNLSQSVSISNNLSLSVSISHYLKQSVTIFIMICHYM